MCFPRAFPVSLSSVARKKQRMLSPAPCTFIFAIIRCRDKERLEKEAEDALYIQHDQAYRRTIDVGRYELSSDILQEDLEHAREKLVIPAEAIVMHHTDVSHLHYRNVSLTSGGSAVVDGSGRLSWDFGLSCAYRPQHRVRSLECLSYYFCTASCNVTRHRPCDRDEGPASCRLLLGQATCQREYEAFSCDGRRPLRLLVHVDHQPLIVRTLLKILGNDSKSYSGANSTAQAFSDRGDRIREAGLHVAPHCCRRCRRSQLKFGAKIISVFKIASRPCARYEKITPAMRVAGNLLHLY